MFFNMKQPNAAYHEYQNYIQVSMEFFDWVFLTPAEKQSREEEESSKKQAV